MRERVSESLYHMIYCIGLLIIIQAILCSYFDIKHLIVHIVCKLCEVGQNTPLCWLSSGDQRKK